MLKTEETIKKRDLISKEKSTTKHHSRNFEFDPKR